MLRQAEEKPFWIRDHESRSLAEQPPEPIGSEDGEANNDFLFPVHNGTVSFLDERSRWADQADARDPSGQPNPARERIRGSRGDSHDGKLPDAEHIGKVFRDRSNVCNFTFLSESGEPHAGAVERDDADPEIVRDAVGEGCFQPRSR